MRWLLKHQSTIFRRGEAATRPSAETKLDQLSQTFMFSRGNLRLNDYDYRQNGAYFVTICAHQRTCLFGPVKNGVMRLNTWGGIAQEEWRRTERVRPNIQLDAFVIMPNHVHGVLMIVDDAAPSAAGAQMNARTGGNAPGSLGQIIGHFKSIVTKRIRKSAGSISIPVWQRNYYDHVIRTESDLQRVREYIMANPARWGDDDYFADDGGIV